ncbi:hypothetical protein HID58_066312 [Brassica napus]|uniref:Uncharacterized protein n=1 Tax=Brassica napus TaxID=3708 RepID=A0ABQ7ZFQ8_BRANA|nr:hypothetical protein HID58_066312 [Brassica napus]
MKVPMVFREWDPGRKRVGIAHEIPNLHQDYGISKQGKVHDDLIRGDQSGLIGLQGNMKKTEIDRGSKILRSTIYTDTCDLGSSSGDGLDNKGDSFGFTWRVDKGINDLLEVGPGKIIAILEDNQIGEREEKKQGPGKVLFKNQTVAGRSIMKKLVQGFVLPHKRTSAEDAKAGIRAHPNHDTFMDQSDKEVKLRWQVVWAELQWAELQWQFTHNTLVFRLFGFIIGTTTDSALGLIKPTVQDGMEGNHTDMLESGFVAVLSCLLTRRMMYATGGGPKHIWFSIWFGLVVLDYGHRWDKSASQQTVQMGRDNDNKCSLCYFDAVFCYHSSLSITVCNVVLSMFGNTMDFAGFYFGCNMSLSRTYFRWGIWSLSNITSSETSLNTGKYGMFSLVRLMQWMHLTLILWSGSKIRSNIGAVIVGFDVRLHTKV